MRAGERGSEKRIQEILAMKCPHCGKKINAASIMGAAGKGKPKDFSKAERKRRSDRMKALNVARRAESQNH